MKKKKHMLTGYKWRKNIRRMEREKRREGRDREKKAEEEEAEKRVKQRREREENSTAGHREQPVPSPPPLPTSPPLQVAFPVIFFGLASSACRTFTFYSR